MACSQGAAWLVSALGCDTAATGSIPVWHPSLGQDEENYLPTCRSHLPSSGRRNTQQENIPRKNNVCIVREITKNRKSAGHGTSIFYFIGFVLWIYGGKLFNPIRINTRIYLLNSSCVTEVFKSSSKLEQLCIRDLLWGGGVGVVSW